jgi:flagellar biosynthesis protein
MDDTSPDRAVALRRHGNTNAGQLVAKGYGDLAGQIIAEARRHGIYVHNAPELVDLLMQLDLDARIPAHLYDVVAQLVNWIAECDAQEADAVR